MKCKISMLRLINPKGGGGKKVSRRERRNPLTRKVLLQLRSLFPKERHKRQLLLLLPKGESSQFTSVRLPHQVKVKIRSLILNPMFASRMIIQLATKKFTMKRFTTRSITTNAFETRIIPFATKNNN